MSAKTLLFHNATGAKEIKLGATRLVCMGAPAPLDHPHVALDIGNDNFTTCPYCSVRYVHDPDLEAGQAIPSKSVYQVGDGDKIK